MNKLPDFEINDNWILARRGQRNRVDPKKPYAWLTEKELVASGKIEDTGVIFLTNRECPFRCLMCDLWKNTTDESVPPGIIPDQIEWALNKMPHVKQVKLYNNGSFFDTRAIPEKDYERIASLLSGLKTVIVESHPALINHRCLAFRDMLKADLQIALGLETVHPEILMKLNKKMTLHDFTRAVSFLKLNGILSRAFILLKPPFMSESEGIYWAERSIDFAFKAGAECCIIIPVRAGNGAMDYLAENDLFSPPEILSLEKVVEYGIKLNAGCIFSDTWDLNLLPGCEKCAQQRIRRLSEMNLKQEVTEQVRCECDTLK